jgi:hypothetical protein
MTDEIQTIIDTYKKWLVSGDRKVIARDTGKTANYVSMVLSKKAFNMDIVQRMRKRAIENARQLGVNID